VGNGVNPANNRRYDNLYCYIFERRGDQLVLFREYQDTLLLFDVWVAE
jgi:ketosteroid isomerase-like protein